MLSSLAAMLSLAGTIRASEGRLARMSARFRRRLLVLLVIVVGAMVTLSEVSAVSPRAVALDGSAAGLAMPAGSLIRGAVTAATAAGGELKGGQAGAATLPMRAVVQDAITAARTPAQALHGSTSDKVSGHDIGSSHPSAPPAAPAATLPYRARHFDLHPLKWDQLWYNDETHLPKVTVGFPRDANGIPMVWQWGHKHYSPVELAISGLKRLHAWVVTGDQAYLDQALKQAKKLRDMAYHARGAAWEPWDFNWPREHLHKPWYHAYSQGMTLAFFVRLYIKTDDPIHLEAANAVFQSFMALGPDQHPWVAYPDADRYLWLEHYPSDHPTHALSAHLFATLGIEEYWQLTGNEDARNLLLGAITTMRDNLYRYRRPGKLSYYDLYHFTHNPPLKHGRVILSLRRLAIVSGDPYFAKMAKKFAEDYPLRQ